METLLSKRRAAAVRGVPEVSDDSSPNHVEWSAVEEGFRLLERDLAKLQACQRHFFDVSPMCLSDISNSSKSTP